MVEKFKPELVEEAEFFITKLLPPSLKRPMTLRARRSEQEKSAKGGQGLIQPPRRAKGIHNHILY
ncbi:hypothetical protein HY227_02625 [Candidatus Wolfebacteria bacterium]|nr:hypothetical protein [Candidatus Wolfebacteria bacterium]